MKTCHPEPRRWRGISRARAAIALPGEGIPRFARDDTPATISRATAASRRTPKLVVALIFFAAVARADFRDFKLIPVDPSIETKLRHVAGATLKEFPKLKADDLAITLIDVTKQSTISRGDYHGNASFYPASVIKLFFMLETFHQAAQHKIELTPETRRALKEMIFVSDNDATAYIVDLITDSSSGPELSGRALEKFLEKRRIVNRYLAPMEYDVSAMAKPWSFGPFGRDMQLLGPNRENRNRATSNALASLLFWILRGKAVSAEASTAMGSLLVRPIEPLPPGENQVKEFIGEALPPGSKLWSKAGWTSEVRHDAAYFELPNRRKMILVIFTRGIADDVKLIPSIAKKVLAEQTIEFPQ